MFVQTKALCLFRLRQYGSVAARCLSFIVLPRHRHIAKSIGDAWQKIGTADLLQWVYPRVVIGFPSPHPPGEGPTMPGPYLGYLE